MALLINDNAAPDAFLNLPLAQFERGHRAPQDALSSRLTSLALTSALAGLLVFFAAHRSLWLDLQKSAPAEVVTQLMREQPHKTVIPPPPPVSHLIRPRAETPAPPSFTVATQSPPARASLPATAAKTSPLAGGAPQGTGAGAGSASGNGANGTGKGLYTCWDAAWARAITEKVRPYFHYPRDARERNVSGVAVVQMTIEHNGMLAALDIYKSSGDAVLDRAAYDMVKKAQPLPRIPDRMHMDRVTALFPIVFGAADDASANQCTCNS